MAAKTNRRSARKDPEIAQAMREEAARKKRKATKQERKPLPAGKQARQGRKQRAAQATKPATRRKDTGKRPHENAR